VNLLLGLLHGIDFAFSSWITGYSIFYFFIVVAGGDSASRLLADFPIRIRGLLLATLLTSMACMLLSAADMAESWKPTDLWNAMAMTTFGHLWCVRIGLLAVLALVINPLLKRRWSPFPLAGLISLIPLLSVLSGHSGSQTDYIAIRVAVDWAHAMAVGVWSGGLWLLQAWLTLRLLNLNFDPQISYRVVQRFSHFAMVSTAIIVATGVATAYMNGVSLFQPWESDYGRLILGKIFFFGLALLAAAVNHFRHLRHWRTENELESVRFIRREVRLEFAILLVVFLIAGFLSRTALPGMP
jgi:putative copper export protein